MPSKTIFEFLSIPPDSALPSVEQALVANVKERIQSVAETYDEVSVSAEEQDIRALFAAWFSYVAALLPKGPVSAKETPATEKLKATARGLMADIETNIVDFALCYMLINRHMTLVRDEIRKEERFLNVGGKKIEWTSDMDFMIRKYKKRKQEIDAENIRLAQGYILLEKAAADYRALEEAAEQMAGSSDKEALLRSFNSALRTKNRAKLSKAIHALEEYRRKFSLAGKADGPKQAAVEAAKRFSDVVLANEATLENEEGRLYLQSGEIRSAIATNERELIRIRQYMAKYHMPYMQGKLSSLARLKDKLLVVGTLDSLMTLYLRLVRGLSDPLTDLAALREFESQGVESAQYLINTRFQEVPLIREHSEKIVREFTRDLAEYNKDVRQMADEKREANGS